MKNVILLDSDRIISKCVSDELTRYGIKTYITSNAEEAIAVADNNKPGAIICDLVVSNHSGSEFLYEFRTYSDWNDVPVIVFSSIKPSQEVIASNDFKLLNIHEFMYKPSTSLKQLRDSVISVLR
jgi:DNA-binding response OmpR family regulator